jgi:ubiquinone/menaquinone biosynthesis C-methylase UbiE
VAEGEHAPIQAYFERGFMGASLAEQVQELDGYYLVDRIREMAAEHQPMLEAGCGSGKWVAWAAQQGWEAIGVDWSAELMRRAGEEVPDATFLAGDIRDMPLADGSVGSLMSLGAVEHATEGPGRALREFARVLRSGGRALVTVPFLSPVRRRAWTVILPLRYSPLLRRVTGKSGGRRPVPRDAGIIDGWTAEFLATEDGWSFYEYQLDESMMRPLIAEAGLVVDEEFVFASEEGLIQTFGALVGGYGEQGPYLNPLGRMLRSVLPAGSHEHMLGYLLHKPSS